MNYKLYVISDMENQVIPNESIYCSIKANSLAEGIRQAVFDDKEAEYVGVLTRGRYFIRYELPVDEAYLDSLFDKYEMIIPYDGVVGAKTLKEQFGVLTNKSDILDRLEEIIVQYFPEYRDAYEYCFGGNRIFTENMVIARKDILKEFYRWADNVINILNNGCLSCEREDYHGWADEYNLLIGWLLKVFICTKNIHSCSVFEYKKNPEIWLNADRKNELVQQYVDNVLTELLSYRKEYGFEEPLADELSPVDFGEKIPVWACWWQGADTIPEMPSICLDSIKRNLPSNSELIIITLENVMRYVSFTPEIIDKFNQGIITYTHMSDILRAELLYRYGGMWVDVTYYAPKAISEIILKQDFYTIGFGKRLWANDVMKGRWTLSMIVTPPKHPTMQFLMEGLWTYWDKASELVDYYLIDFVFEAGYKNFAEIKKAVDSSLLTSTKMIDLQLRMNQRITDKEKKWLIDTSVFYKLNRKNEYHTLTPEGDITFYGYMALQAGRHDLLKQYDNELCNQVRVIECGTIQKVMDIIRHYNPINILDYGLSLYRNGWVNKGMIREILLHSFMLIGMRDEELSLIELPIISSVYDKIINRADYPFSPENIIFSEEFCIVLLPEGNSFDLIILGK